LTLVQPQKQNWKLKKGSEQLEIWNQPETEGDLLFLLCDFSVLSPSPFSGAKLQ